MTHTEYLSDIAVQFQIICGWDAKSKKVKSLIELHKNKLRLAWENNEDSYTIAERIIYE